MSALPPLLMIAAGGQPRPRKAPPSRPKESKLQCDIAELLRCHALPSWLWTHFPAGELRDVITGARLKRMGLQRGWPDFLLVSPHGSVRFLELKRQGEPLSCAQEEFRVFCIRHGILHVVADTFDQALAILDHWGCLRVKIGGSS
jgi:VRR-NUC domain